MAMAEVELPPEAVAVASAELSSPVSLRAETRSLAATQAGTPHILQVSITAASPIARIKCNITLLRAPARLIRRSLADL